MSNANRKKIAVVMLLILGFGATILGGIWWSGTTGVAYTDNAYVHANITAIAPKVSGYVTEVHVDDNTQVKAGELLFKIDERDYATKVAQAEAALQAAKAANANAEASIYLQYATIAQAVAQHSAAIAVQTRMSQENARQTRLRKENATSEHKFEEAVSSKSQADASLAGAEANLEVQRRKLHVLSAQLDSAKASLAQAEAALALAKLDLEHCSVRAPVDGIIGNRKIRLGRYVSPGVTLFELVPMQDVWIVANFKETELEHIISGQRVTVKIDGYPDASLEGTVDSLAPGSGSAFSLMPPDNATGNFVRVVQRVPVKIRLTGNTMEGRIVPGLSARVTVHPASPQNRNTRL